MNDELTAEETIAATRACLRNVLLSMAKVEETMGGSAGLSGRIVQVARALKIVADLQAVSDPLGAALVAMKDFAAFCVAELSEKELNVARKAIRTFVDRLKAEAK